MTFWEMFNNHPFVGATVAISAIFAAATSAIDTVNAIERVLRAKITGAVCDCEPCDLEHVGEEATCGIASGIHADDELCTLPEAHDGPCSHGTMRCA